MREQEEEGRWTRRKEGGGERIKGRRKGEEDIGRGKGEGIEGIGGEQRRGGTIISILFLETYI